MPPRGPKAPAISRARECPKCGADQWRKRKNDDYICMVCDARRSREWQSKVRRNDPARAMFERAKKRAAKEGTVFSITVDDVRNAWPSDNKCPILGCELITASRAAEGSSPSLDRLNPSWGYEKGNIAIIAHAANRAKGRMTAEDLEKIAAWMRGQGLN